MYIYIYIYMYLDDQVICFFLVVFFSPRIPDKHNELGKNLRGHKIFSSLRGPNPPDAQLMCALTSLSSSLTGQAFFLLSWSLSFSFKEVTFVKLLSPNTTVKTKGSLNCVHRSRPWVGSARNTWHFSYVILVCPSAAHTGRQDVLNLFFF